MCASYKIKADKRLGHHCFDDIL